MGLIKSSPAEPAPPIQHVVTIEAGHGPYLQCTCGWHWSPTTTEPWTVSHFMLAALTHREGQRREESV